MSSYVTIYGELVTGEIVREYENTVLVRTAKGGHHMVHKSSIKGGYKRKEKKRDRMGNSKSFDLEKSQTKGPLRNDMRHWSFK